MIKARKAEYSDLPRWKGMIEVQSQVELDELESPRVLNTHLHVHDLRRGILERGCIIVVVHRNPKDVCVSQFCQVRALCIFNGTWEDFLSAFTDHKRLYTSICIFFLPKDQFHQNRSKQQDNFH